MFKRVRFFSGQILTAQDFQAEQEYHVGKRRFLNQQLFGAGIVAGLDVTTDNGSVVVSAGFALDAMGNEIVVDQPAQVNTKTCVKQACFLFVRYTEISSDPVPARSGELEFSRITEGFALETHDEADMQANAVCLARLLRDEGGWVVDRSYGRNSIRGLQEQANFAGLLDH